MHHLIAFVLTDLAVEALLLTSADCPHGRQGPTRKYALLPCALRAEWEERRAHATQAPKLPYTFHAHGEST
jgi:hypothetical protein